MLYFATPGCLLKKVPIPGVLVQEGQVIQVEVHQLIPGECTSTGVECGGFQRKVISYTKVLFTSSVGEVPSLDS